ncbi:fimbrillin family protein [Bacteroides sp. 519]|uniref:fimbrillin family protein n=1 Tax=Bacteroides sp. 519 TaxID=2302937 RepID=UPI0013D574D5|nr:fimbrillin family protein [Bacteroides sp. 519]
MNKKPLSIFNCALSIAATSLLLLAGCDTDDTGGKSNDLRTPLTISAGSEALHPNSRGSEALHPGSRAVDATWHTNDAIGVYTYQTGTTTVYDAQANLQYRNTAGDGATATFAPADAKNTAYYPTNGAALDVIAYYPHNSQLSTLNSQLPIQAGTDFMTSALVAGHSEENPEVALVFRHRLSKLAMLIKTDESTAHIDPASAAITLHGTATQGTYHLLEQKMTEATDVKDIRLTGRTAIVLPTAAGSGVSFTVEAGGKSFTAALPGNIAFEAGKVTTVTITLKEQQTGGDETAAAISATITDWEGGPTTEVDAIRFTQATNPETGEPAIQKFTITKNGTTSSVYEYVDGTWGASNGFFLISETTATDQFTATAQGDTDPISQIADELAAGPATMNSEGIIKLDFRHTKALLKLRLYAGTGFTGNLAEAKVTYQGISYTGAEKELIIEPGAFKVGDVIATVLVDGYTYNVKTAKDVNFASGTRNTLSITLSVQNDTSGRTVGLNVTTKDWEVGTDASAAANRVVINSPADGNTALTEFTLYKNRGTAGEAAVSYQLVSGAYQPADGAAPFYLEDIDADNDLFTGSAVLSTDAVTGVDDLLETPAVKLNGEGVIDLAFAHSKAKLTVNLVAGTDFPAGIDLNTAVLKLIGQTQTVTGASNTFILEPGTTIPANLPLATITVGGLTYSAKLDATMKLEAGKYTTLTVTLTPTAAGIVAHVTDWKLGSATGGAAVTLPANNLSALPNEAGTLTLACNGLSTTYTWGGTAITAGTDLYWENIAEAASYAFTLTFTPNADDVVTGKKDILQGTATVTTRGGQPTFQLTHTHAKLTLVLEKGTNFPAGIDLNTAVVKLMNFEPTATGVNNSFIVEPTTTALAAGTQIATITVGGLTYVAKLDAALTLEAGVQTALKVTLSPTAVTLSVTVADWGTPVDFTATAKVQLAANSLSALPGSGTLVLAYGSETVTYTWDGTKLNGNNHFYWENIPQTNPAAFTLTFTPSASGTPEKDVLKKTITSYTHSTALAFELAHINSRINVTLAKGNTYNDTDWAAIKADNKTTLTFAGLSSSDYAPVYNYTNGLAAIFAPKAAMADSDKITVAIPATGTVKANTVTIALKNYMASLEAGKMYDITITVDKTTVSVGDIKVADWTTITGSGEMDY